MISKDINSTPARVKPLLSSLLDSLVTLAQAQLILLRVVDTSCPEEYTIIVKKYVKYKRDYFITEEKEVFTLGVCLVNVFTEAHFDSRDVKGGWAPIAICGELKNGALAITELKRRFAYKPGDLSYLQAECFEHFTL